tara:strand:+ start:289 stop:642 length:354 start_codon:yes stop_codon:yes gene_type:complete
MSQSQKYIILSDEDKELLIENIYLIHRHLSSERLNDIFNFIKNYKIPFNCSSNTLDSNNHLNGNLQEIDINNYCYYAPKKLMIQGVYNSFDLSEQNDVYNYYLDKIQAHCDHGDPLY